ncbi:MAG: exonuclease [Chloroflexi bacterium]|nr:exonuclease [Chloroflexota bacterium]
MNYSTYVSLDLETTGFDPERDEIIEVAAVKFRADAVVEVFHTLVKPQGALPYRIQVLTGITERELHTAPPFEVVISDLVSFIGDRPIVGQSIGTDLKFLAHWGLEFTNPVYDTHDLSRVLLPTLAERSLAAVAAHLGIDLTNKHRALPDTMAAKDVFLALRERARALDRSVLAAIVNLGAGWRAARFFQEVLVERAAGAGRPAAQGEQVPTLGALTETWVSQTLGEAEPARSLKPAAQRRPVDPAALSRFLAAGGPLSRVVPGFEERPQQVAMMREVARTLNAGGRLMVEAGTGTGKSVAYLLPALVFASENSTPVVVSTNTINLQEQLVQKDIPNLLEALRAVQEADEDTATTEPGQDLPDLSAVRVTQLKGRANYLCLRRWENLDRMTLEPEEVVTAARILVWLSQTQTGDRAELNLAANEMSLWNKVSARAEDGAAGPCSYLKRGLCFLQRARRTAETSHLVVVNHALLLSDALSDNAILPDYGHLIIDEAHHLEDVATDQFGFRVGIRDANDLLNRVSQEVGARRYQGFAADAAFALRSAGPLTLAAQLARQAEALHEQVAHTRSRVSQHFNALAAFLQGGSPENRDYGRRLRLTHAVRAQRTWTAVERTWEDAYLALGDLELALGKFAHGLEDVAGEVARAEDLMAELTSLRSALAELRRKANACIANPDPNMVYWLADSGLGEPPVLHAAPLEVGRVLEEHLFSPRETVVLTSATLRSAGSFTYIRDRLGVGAARELALPSPFDYRSSTLIYLPQDIPEPERPGYPQAVEQALVELCRAAEGRTLVLFTSYGALQTAYHGIRRTLERDKILVLGHGMDGSANQLLTAFKSNPRSVLLGTNSFWEGIDVVGDALSVLVITKLPFAVPTDPVISARAELFKEPFTEYTVPQAVLRFRQGFGRLIRSKSDRGALVVLDRRVHGRGYGAAFLESLPPCTVQRGPTRGMAATVAAWLQRDAAPPPDGVRPTAARQGRRG